MSWIYADAKEQIVWRDLGNGLDESRTVNDPEVQQYIADGGTIDPYVPPPETKPAPQPSQQDQILFDHENRIRAQEGAPPLTLADFVAKVQPP